MAGFVNRDDDELDRVNVEVNAGGDHQAITTATNEEVAIIIANEPNGPAKLARMVESTSQNHGEPSKAAQGLETHSDKAFKCCPDGFCEMVGRHKARNEQLSERESELRQRLATLESWIPAVTLIKMLTGEVDSSNIYNIIDEQAMTMSTSNARLHTSLSQHKDSRIRDIEAERKEAHRRLEEARKLLREKQSAVDERAKQIEEAQRKHISLEQKIGQLQEQFERDGIDLMKVTSGESILSFGPDDLACIIKLEELVAAEEHTKHQVEELERKEEAYMKTLRAAGHIIPKDRKHPEVDELRDQLHVKSAANQRMADRICLLEDQVENLKGKLARCNDHVEQLTTHSKQSPITKNGGAGERENGKTKMDKAITAKSTTVNVAAGSDRDTVKRSEQGVNARVRTDSKETLTRVERTDRSIQEVMTDNERPHEKRPTKSQNTHDHSKLPSIHEENTSVSRAKLSGDQSASKERGQRPPVHENTSAQFFDTNNTRQSEGERQQSQSNSDSFESSGVRMASNDSRHNMRSASKKNPDDSARRMGPASVRFEQHDASGVQSDVSVRNESIRSPGRSQQSGVDAFGSDHASIDRKDDESNIRLYQEDGMPEITAVDDSGDQSHSYVDIPPMTSQYEIPSLSSNATKSFDDSGRSMRSVPGSGTGDQRLRLVSFKSAADATISHEDNRSNIRQYQEHGMPEMTAVDDSGDQSHSYVDIPPMTSQYEKPSLSSNATKSFDDSQRSMRSVPGSGTGDQRLRLVSSKSAADATISREDNRSNIRQYQEHGMPEMTAIDDSGDQSHSYVDIPPMTSQYEIPASSSHVTKSFDDSQRSMRSVPGSGTGDQRPRLVSFKSAADATISREENRSNIRQYREHGMPEMTAVDDSGDQSHSYVEIPPMRAPSFDDTERSMKSVPGTSDQRAKHGGVGSVRFQQTGAFISEAERNSRPQQTGANVRGRDETFMSLKSKDSSVSARFTDDSSSSPPPPQPRGKFPKPPPFLDDESSRGIGNLASRASPRRVTSPGRQERIVDADQGDRIELSRVQLEMWLANVTDIRRQISRCPSCQSKQRVLVQMCRDLCQHLRLQPNICMEEDAVAHRGGAIEERAQRPNARGMPLRNEEMERLYATQIEAAHFARDNTIAERSSEYDEDSARDVSVGYPIGMSTRIEDDDTNSPPRRHVSRIVDCTDSTFSDINQSKQSAGRGYQPQQDGTFVSLQSTLPSDSGEAAMISMSRNNRDGASARRIENNLTGNNQSRDPLRARTNEQPHHNNDPSFVSLKSTLDSTGTSNFPDGYNTSGDRLPMQQNADRSVPLAPVEHNRLVGQIEDVPQRPQLRIVRDIVLHNPGRQVQIAGRTGLRQIEVDAKELAIWRENISDIRRYISRCPICRAKRRALVSMCKAICQHLQVPSDQCEDDGDDYGAPIVVIPRQRADPMIGRAPEYDERALSRAMDRGWITDRRNDTSISGGARSAQQSRATADSLPHDGTIDLVSTQYSQSHDRTIGLTNTLDSTGGMHSSQHSVPPSGQDFRITDSTRYGEPPIMDPITGSPFGTSTPIRKQSTRESPRSRTARQLHDPQDTRSSRSHDRSTELSSTLESNRGMHSTRQSEAAGGQDSRITDSTYYGEPPIMDPITGSPVGTSTPTRRQRTGQSPRSRTARQLHDPQDTVYSRSHDRSTELSSTLESNRGMHSTRQSEAVGGQDSRIADSTYYGEPPILDPITGSPVGTSTPRRRQRTGQSPPTRSAQESFDPDMTKHTRSHDQTFDTTVGTPRSRRKQSPRQRSGISNEQHFETVDSIQFRDTSEMDATRYGEPPIMDPITGSPFGTSTPKRRKCTEQSRQTKSSRESAAEDEDESSWMSSYMRDGTRERIQYGLEEMRGESSGRRDYTGTSFGPIIRRKTGKGRAFDESNDKKIPVLGRLSGSQDQLFQEAPSSPYVLSDSESQRDSRSEDDEERERWRMAETRPISREQSKRITRKMEKEGRVYREALRKKDIISDTERSSISGPSTSHVQSIQQKSCCICPFSQITRSEYKRSMGDNCRPCPVGSSDPVRYKPIDMRHKKTKQDYPKEKLITMSSMKTQTAARRRDVNDMHSSDFDCEVCDCEPCGTPSPYHSNPGKTRVDVATNVPSRPTKRNRSLSAKKARTNG